MGHPRRHLAAYVDGELPPARFSTVEGHLRGCQSCREAVQAQQRVQSRLRSPVPGPDSDLSRRILARTRTGTSGAWAEEAGRTRTRPSSRRVTAAALGAAAVISGATLSGAYLVGAEPAPVAGTDRQDTITAGWNSVAASTPAALAEQQLDVLRADGWNCPELTALGFHLESAEAITVAGKPTLRLILSNGEDSVTLYEQRKSSEVKAAAAPPLNAVTGNPVTSDGFEQIGGMQRDLWVNPQHSWQVVVDSEAVTYTVASSMPAADIPAAVSHIVYTEQAQLAPSVEAPDNDPLQRILRGLSRLAQSPGH